MFHLYDHKTERRPEFMFDRLLLDQAMRNFKVEHPSLEQEMDFLGYDISNFEMSVVNVNRTCKVRR